MTRRDLSVPSMHACGAWHVTRRCISTACALGLALVLPAGCGASTAPPAQSAPAPPPPPSDPPPPKLPAGHVWRHQVMQVMSPGMGAFLGRLEVEEHLVDGAFHGFRIVQLRGDPAFWSGVDLKPGDVVTRVNGQPIGHYDQAYEVWTSLATAPELVVTYERAGREHQLRYVIHEDGERR